MQLEKSAKEAVSRVFCGSVALPTTAAKVKTWSEFELEGDFILSLNILRSLPDHDMLAHELSFLNLCGNAGKMWAALALWMQNHPNRKDRKLTEELRKSVSELRMEIKVLDDFVKQKAAIFGQMFKVPSGDVRDSLRGRSSAALGVALDVADMPKTLDGMRALVSNLVMGWVRDADELAALVTSWGVSGWEPYKNKILSDENAAIREKLEKNGDYTRCSTGAAMLNTWRGHLRALNHDGCGVLIDANKLKELGTIVKSASDCCEMSYSLHHVLCVIPNIKNINLRKANAKAFQKEMKGRFDVGEDLEQRLKALATNGTAFEDEC